jgi:hypothetical protein
MVAGRFVYAGEGRRQALLLWIQSIPLLTGAANPNSGLILLNNNTQAYAIFFFATGSVVGTREVDVSYV